MICSVNTGLTELAFAFVLDMAIGDPQWSYHPVRCIGRSIACTERLLRKLPIPERISGILLTVTITSTTFFAAYTIVSLSRRWSNLCEIIAGAVIIYFAISLKSLADESKKVTTALRENDLIKARRALSMIVGRDTANLDQEQIARACVETISEGSVDGVLSPIFYAFLGGPGAAMAYKAVNTLDSMVGYKNEKYLRFGWASARLDDLANYIPARISAFLIPAAAFFCGYSFRRSLKIALRDGRKHESPNSGIPEAAMAGALGVQLGGASTYQGEVVAKPFIGDSHCQLTPESIDAAMTITYIASLLFIVCGIGITICLKYCLS